MTDCIICGGGGCDACVAPAARGKAVKARKPTAAQERKAARRAAPAPKVVDASENDEFAEALRQLDAFGILAPVEKHRYRMELVPKIPTPVRNRLAAWKRRLHQT